MPIIDQKPNILAEIDPPPERHLSRPGTVFCRKHFGRKQLLTENNELFSTPLANDKPMDAKILYICMIVSFFLGFIVSNIV